jgi:hypothetical protein
MGFRETADEGRSRDCSDGTRAVRWRFKVDAAELCGVTLPFESRALPKLQANAGRMQNATSDSLPFPYTPHIPAIIPPIIAHPRLPSSCNSLAQILH